MKHADVLFLQRELSRIRVITEILRWNQEVPKDLQKWAMTFKSVKHFWLIYESVGPWDGHVLIEGDEQEYFYACWVLQNYGIGPANLDKPYNINFGGE